MTAGRTTLAGGPAAPDDWPLVRAEWAASLDDVLRDFGPGRTQELLRLLEDRAQACGVPLDDVLLNTPYRNTIPAARQPPYPGDLALEARLEGWLRWNAMAMVLQASDSGSGVGGHIATYGSAATLMEVALHHFVRNRSADYGGDIVNFQPHAAPGVYARAFLEGRLTAGQLASYRRELAAGGGLSSYPHPRRMPALWPCPTASMGLATAISVYLARFARYLESRGLKPRNGGRVWCFIGDGEADEPEVLGTLATAARERLDNLTIVVNCNLQRLDGPVRGNGKVIQELERMFRGAGWEVIKVIWGSEWDPLLARDDDGRLQRRMDEALDGDYQLYSVMPGDQVRAHWVRDDARLAALMQLLDDEQIRSIRRGGHDPLKIYAALDHAIGVRGRPTVVLAKTIKGYGLGPGAEGRNAVHQQKSLSDEERLACARRFGVPLDDAAIRRAEFWQPPADSPELAYLQRRRAALGGYQPGRAAHCEPLPLPADELFATVRAGSAKAASTTQSCVRLLGRLLRDPGLGRFIVPIVPDEARTFGMDGLFRQAGIWSSAGQRYRPVDAGALTAYREAADGQILQEGICEAGAIASFIAAGTAYAHFGVPALPFYFFYSMFGFQRVGDFIWAAGDALCRGFLIGGTAGRTTLNGEGLQHQDGHSPVLAATVPAVVSYDPAWGHELAVIVREGLRRMVVEQEAVMYYLTVYNEPTEQPPLPEGAEDGILRGLYRCRPAPELPRPLAAVDLLGSGVILQQALAAQRLLAAAGIAAAVWSVTSYTELYRDALDCERANREPGASPPREPYVTRALRDSSGIFVAASDYMRLLPSALAAWLPGELVALGTDGWGLSESRAALRTHFGIDARAIAGAALAALGRRGRLSEQQVATARRLIETAPEAGCDE